ncbi:NAD(P)-dependent oxidoreductase [Streptomyces sulfonofaciens]|uniref:NAD(P)-dependent oxidoreductase n=1 Tax=Streptomyces sulfonofaciens TaxID=68272 RepID=UPI001E57F7CD|nr:NAD(P)-dependent oxidoreductase [Streptomyces sulfonofaciens]
MEGALKKALAGRGGPAVHRYCSQPAAPTGQPIVCIGSTPPPALLQDGSSLVWFHSSNAGVDAVLRAGLPSGVLLTRTVGRMGERIAQFVLGWLLSECQRVPDHLAQQRGRRWQRLPSELAAGQLAVVYGTGAIGARIGHALGVNGIRAVGVSRTGRQSDAFDDVLTPDRAGEVLARARWVINALPLTAATAQFFGDPLLRKLNGATFVNVGRGATVDMAALDRALHGGQVRAAVLDVLAEEPAAPDDACWSLPRTTITSHSAGITHDEDVVHDFLGCWEDLRGGAARPSLAVRPARGY